MIPSLTTSDVSVAIPARNAARYLDQAIASALGQSSPPLEVIVVDDGSTDETAAVAASYGARVRLVRRDAGPGNAGASRSIGVEHAKGSVLAFLDADDYWEPEWLSLGVAALDERPAPDLVFGRMREFISPDLDPEEAARLAPAAVDRPAFYAPGMLVRRSTYERIGAFNTENPGAEFTDWLLRARDLGLNELVLDRVTVNRRLHLTNATRVHRQQLRDHAVVIKASLDRRRASGAL